MNNLLISLTKAPVKSDKSHKDYNKVEPKKEKFDSVIQKASKKLDKVESHIKKQDIHLVKNRKIDLEETQGQLDISIQETMIINLLADYLQIPVEKVDEVLQNLEIIPIALTDKENFGKFMSELYGEPIEELLLNNSSIKSISNLWEKLEEMGKVFNHNGLLTEVYVDKDTQEASEIVDNKQIEDEHTALQSMQVASSKSLEDNSEITVTPILEASQEKVKDTNYAENMGQTTGSEGEQAIRLGLQIPLEAFNASSRGKMWEQASKEQFFSKLGETVAIDNQLLTKIEVIPLTEGKEIHMDLTPKELGKLSFRLVEENGVLTAQIRVENEKTKELVLQSIEALKEGFKEQGLTIGDFTVNVRDQSRQSHMNQERQKSSKRIEEIIAKHLDVIEEELLEEVEKTSSELDIMV